MKVFISSTYIDLVEYRKAAHNALEKLGLHVIWMEAFGARTEDSTTACLKEVEDSDLFVGIYAHRYGYVSKDISITEQEFDHAQKLEKPIFGFIVDEDQEWKIKFVEHGKKAKLDAFIDKVKKRPIEFFTTPDNLAQKIVSSIGHYLAERKTAEAESVQQPNIRIEVEGNFSGNLTIGNQNISNNTTSQDPKHYTHKHHGSTLPRQAYFFGREKELAIIADAINPESRTWGALIDGPGGVGKTALAIKAAHDAPLSIFERKIFITAKMRELKPEGEKPLTDFTRPNYLSMLNELALELGDDGVQRLIPEQRPNALRLALAGKKTLIIFDNLETLPEDERVRLFQFLSRLPDGNKAIVTSRRRADVEARIIYLDPLELKESLQLIAELAINNHRLARTGNNERRQLHQVTNGNPLLIQWVCGQLKLDGGFRTIAEACDFLEKAPPSNDPLEYIFGDLLETCTENETRILAALTHFAEPMTLAWIAKTANLPTQSAETALMQLSDRSILISDAEERTFFLPPLTIQFIRTRRPEIVDETGNALANHVYSILMNYGGGNNYEGFRILENQWNRIAAALPSLLMWDNNRLQNACYRLTRFLDFTGKWDELLWLSLKAEARALTANDKESARNRALDAGWVYYHREQPKDVMVCASRVAEFIQDAPLYQQAAAFRLRGHGHTLLRNYSAAFADYREALDISNSICSESLSVAADLNWLANAEINLGDYNAAERDYSEALRIAKTFKDDEGVAIYTGNLAAIAFDYEQWAKAEYLAREALALAQKIGRQELIASDYHRIALAMLAQDYNLEEALLFSQYAVEIYIRLRMLGNLQWAQKTLAEIERAIAEKSKKK